MVEDQQRKIKILIVGSPHDDNILDKLSAMTGYPIESFEIIHSSCNDTINEEIIKQKQLIIDDHTPIYKKPFIEKTKSYIQQQRELPKFLKNKRR